MRLFFICLIAFSSYAQFNQTLPNLDWKEISTKHFRIIFPNELKSKGELVANAMEKYLGPLSESLEFEDPHHRIDVILNNQSSISNAYVALAPFLSKWESTPTLATDLGSTDWFITLAIHEQRHIHQFLKYKKGFAKFLYYMFGQMGQAVSVFFSTPAWVFEGDATYEETLLSKSGRGRVAQFDMHLRALLDSTDMPDYDEFLYGSYYRRIPNHYVLGYMMNFNLRNYYPASSLNAIFNETARSSYSAFAFENSLEDLLGEDIEKFYKNAHFRYKELAAFGDEDYKRLHKKQEVYTNQSFVFIEKQRMYFQESGFSKVPAIVSMTLDGKDKRVEVKLSNILDHRFDVCDKKILFSDFETHPRYKNVVYSNIYMKDEGIKTISQKQKVFNPIFSKSCNSIYALIFDDSMNQFLIELDTKGKTLLKVKVKDGHLVRNISFDRKSNLLFMSMTDNDGNYYFSKLIGKKIIPINKKMKANVSDLYAYDNTLYFSNDSSGVGNIYKFQANKVFRLTDAKYGIRYPFFHNDVLYFSDYSVDGFYLSRLNKVDSLVKTDFDFPIDQVNKASPKIANVDKKRQSTDYEREFFNIHSWNYLPAVLSSQQASFTISSTDILGELTSNFGIQNDNQKGATSAFATLVYSRYWPVLFAGFSAGKRSVFIDSDETPSNVDYYKWNENSFDLGVLLPYTVTTLGKTYGVSLTSIGKYIKVDDKNYPSYPNSGEVFLKGFNLELKYSTNKAFLRQFADFEINTDFIFQEAIALTGNETYEQVRGINLYTAFKGFTKTSNFLFKGSYQEKVLNTYDIGDTGFFARGYEFINSKLLSSFSANYMFASFYPEFGIFDTLYFKRMRTNLFYDHTRLNNTKEYASAGLENVFDITPFRFSGIELGLGVRSTYRKISDDWEHQVYLESLFETF
ncbi:MAG: hypothetical protein N4A33_11605 [Bacteriovoracaceae bacterium]|jgi:hypothetical protein|nr:hypothetical protein [Bacteriovoracaceae bacterium]